MKLNPLHRDVKESEDNDHFRHRRSIAVCRPYPPLSRSRGARSRARCPQPCPRNCRTGRQKAVASMQHLCVCAGLYYHANDLYSIKRGTIPCRLRCPPRQQPAAESQVTPREINGSAGAPYIHNFFCGGCAAYHRCPTCVRSGAEARVAMMIT